MKKIALVTGAGSEIGKKICEGLLKEGFIVYAGVRDSKETVLISDSIVRVILDVTKNDQIRKVLDMIKRKESKLDVLINVSGVTVNGSAVETKEEDFILMLNVNVLGAFRMIKYFFPLLKKVRNSKVINITSMCGIASFPNMVLYSSSKHALEALGQGMRVELIKEGVWLTNIVPGAIASEGPVKLDYKPMREKYILIKFLMPMVSRKEVANSVLKVVMSKKPPMRILLGNDTKLVDLVKRILPDYLWDKMIRKMW